MYIEITFKVTEKWFVGIHVICNFLIDIEMLLESNMLENLNCIYWFLFWEYKCGQNPFWWKNIYFLLRYDIDEFNFPNIKSPKYINSVLLLWPHLLIFFFLSVHAYVITYHIFLFNVDTHQCLNLSASLQKTLLKLGHGLVYILVITFPSYMRIQLFIHAINCPFVSVCWLYLCGCSDQREPRSLYWLQRVNIIWWTDNDNELWW